MSKVGMIILNYNDSDTTTKYIRKIKDYKIIDRIVVVDNNSSDSSYDALKQLEKGNIAVIKAEENNGYSAGNNIGVKYLGDKVDYIIISNPDIIIEENVIVKLKKEMDKKSDISVISPIIKQHDDLLKGWRLPKIFDEVGLNINYFHKYFEKRLRYKENYYNSRLTRVDVVSGCFFMIRRDVLNLIGNFDEGTFLFYEENILATKLKNINKKIFIDNEVSIIHDESVTINKNMASINRYKVLKTSQKYFVKYYLHANIIQMFILRLFYYISLGIAYIVYFIKKIFNRNK